MAKLIKEKRRIPDLVAAKKSDQSPFDVSDVLITEDYTCFGITQKGTRAMCLKLILNKGEIVLVRYAGFLPHIPFNGRDEITILTSTIKVVVNGKHLEHLMDFIGEQRLAWIKCAGYDSESDAMMMKEGEPVIETIRPGKMAG